MENQWHIKSINAWCNPFKVDTWAVTFLPLPCLL